MSVAPRLSEKLISPFSIEVPDEFCATLPQGKKGVIKTQFRKTQMTFSRQTESNHVNPRVSALLVHLVP